MEVLESLSSILVDIVRSVRLKNGKLAFIREHIKNAESECFPYWEFPPGSDWFNVSTPLTKAVLKGKVVVLDFFTYCCINCMHLLPHLKALEEKFTVADGLVIIGVHSAKFENEKKSSNVALAMKKLSITHPVINDATGAMWTKMKISCWPTLVVIGPGGQALFTLTGEQVKEELFLFTEATLNYYAGKISSHPLPITPSQDIVTSSILCFPTKIVRCENFYAVADTGNHRVLVIDEGGFIKFKIGGKGKGFRDGTLEDAQFNFPQGLAFRSKFEIYVADTDNHSIRFVDLKNNKVKTIVGNGKQGLNAKKEDLAGSVQIASPWDLCFVPPNEVRMFRSRISVLTPDKPRFSRQVSSSSAASAPPPPPPPPPPGFLCSSRSGMLLDSEKPESAEIRRRQNEYKSVLLIAMCGYHQIWALFLEDTVWWKGLKFKKNTCAAVAGSGREENRNNSYPLLASFAQPSGLAYSETHKCVFIADSESSSIRKLSIADGLVTFLAGGDRNPVNLFNFGDVDGIGFDAKFQHPLGLTFSEKGNMLYVCDTYNNKIKKINPNSAECTSMGEKSNLFNEPNGCILDRAEEVLYVADTNNNRIALYNLRDKTVKTWEIKEEQMEDPNNPNANNWELEVEICNDGGYLCLFIEFAPKDVKGTWNLDLSNSNFVSRALNGTISSDPKHFEMEILPYNPRKTDSAKISFYLVICEKDYCIAKKCFLTLLIKRNENGEKIKNMKFNKNLLS